MADDYDEKYTDPDLRREIKDELMKGDKGGDPGEWSARKSQMLVQEYENRGGGYKDDPDQKEAAESLKEWTEQDWQTQDGSAYASEEGGPTKRYLPARAWDLLSEEERDRTDRKKRDEGEDAAKQYVANTVEAKAAHAYVDHGDASDLSEDQLNRLKKSELDDLAAGAGLEGRSKMDKAGLAAALRTHYESGDGGSGGGSDRTKKELYEAAKERGVEGRSKMDKAELAEAVGGDDG